MKKQLLFFVLLLTGMSLFAQKQYTLQSPEKNITVTIEAGQQLTYAVMHGNTCVLSPSPIGMKLADGTQLGTKPVVKSAKTCSVNQMLPSPLYKRAEIPEVYNELTLTLKGNYKVVFRAYNEGVAYRFVTDFRKPIIIESETADFNFDADYQALVPYVLRRAGQEGDLITQQFYNSFENTYTHTPLSQMDPEKLAFLPLLVELKDGKKAVITEADLESFPGLYLRNAEGGNGLSAVHAGYPKVEEQGGHNNLQYIVKERENYIATTDGQRNFPWRCIVISEKDGELADSDMVYLLASPCRLDDISWIQPGKVAWDWWNAWNIYGVDFPAGINNDTYKYYIDFASQYGIEYVILDEGWAVNKKADLFQVVPEIDLQELIDYGAERNVGIVLWAGHAAIDKDMERVCQHFSDMGVAGFKVDFMDRDDQKVVEFYYRMAETAARYNLFIDFHGAYKPTGLNRTYPNVLNHEGVYGLEQAKWDGNSDLVTNEVTIPFIRMVAGPMDYTQGAMRNANKYNFAPVYTEPMSQGTRCRQLAEYIIFESPFNMLCDSPSNYLNEDECTQFIASVPTTWDETIVLDGKVGEYLVIARRKDFHWYVGAITNWEERDFTLDLSVLPNFGAKSGQILRDGINANRVAKDYVAEQIQVMANKVQVHLAKGGGVVMVF
jgi:alpha-glucosidase